MRYTGHTAFTGGNKLQKNLMVRDHSSNLSIMENVVKKRTNCLKWLMTGTKSRLL
jgi:hypothetical protein